MTSLIAYTHVIEDLDLLEEYKRLERERFNDPKSFFSDTVSFTNEEQKIFVDTFIWSPEHYMFLINNKFIPSDPDIVDRVHAKIRRHKRRRPRGRRPTTCVTFKFVTTMQETV